MHTHADAVATADFEGEEDPVDWHVPAWWLVSWHQMTIVRPLRVTANGALPSVCVVSIYRVPKMYSISLSDVSCMSPSL